MQFEIQATYENGVLKPEKPLPLDEHQRVTVVVHDTASIARRSYGIIGWCGGSETVRQVALDTDGGIMESP